MRKSVFLFLLLMAACAAQSARAGEYAPGPGLISKHLPEWIEAELEFRYRYEFWGDFDFNDKRDDNDGFNLKRTRLGIRLKPHDQIRLYYQLQDARIDNDETLDAAKASFENWADTKRLYVQLLDIFAAEEGVFNGINFTFGRIGLKYGDQRLLGDPEWSNVGHSFDGGKAELVLFDRNLQLDVFGAKKTLIKIPREHDDLFEGDSQDMVVGYYGSYRGFTSFTIEQYLIHRDTDVARSFGPSASGMLDQYTLGACWKGQVPESPFDYAFETAYQWGDMGALDISAWMATGEAGYRFGGAWEPRASVGVDFASGDADAADGERNTFDTHYPEGFKPLGMILRHSLQNIIDYKIGLSVRPTPKLSLEGKLHILFLDTPNDYMYVVSAAPLRAVTGADFDSYTGNELNISAKYKATEYLELRGGYGHYFAGDYLDDTGEADDADLFYVETIFTF